MRKFDSTLGRRAFLKAGVGAVGTLALAGCRRDEVTQLPITELAIPDGPQAAAWTSVRDQFVLDAGTAYMNNASLGMPPAPVVDAVAAGYRAISEEPLHGKHLLQERIAEQVMPGLATYFGCRADELSLTRNATEALHLQTVGLALDPGDEVLITTQEHPAGQRPWLFRAERHGISVREVFIPSPLPSRDEVVERMREAIGPRTRALAFCHVTRGGHRYPVEALTRLAHENGLLSMVDGAQAVGQFGIDLPALGCDAYSGSIHKWMLGPVGTGFLYVRGAVRDRIRTAFAPGATNARPEHAPAGTADFPVRAAIATALEFTNILGIDAIEARCRHLSDYLKAGLAEIGDVRLLSGATPQLSAPGSTIFEKEGLDAVAAVPLFEERANVHIDEHQRDGHNAIRVSTHIYNTESEIDRFLDALSTV